MSKPRKRPNPHNSIFIKLMNDWSFKYIFGTEQHAHILLRFLNAVFEGEMTISKVTFQNKELLPQTEKGKKIQYDIYCTTTDNRHFILEMQQEESENFPGRILFYVSRAIVEQGRKGVEYHLDPVCCIVISDFDLSIFSPRLVHDVVLMDRNTHEEYTNHIRLLFCSLEQVPEDWEDCDTELLRLLYLIKNMETMTKESKPYVGGQYQEIFNACEYDNLSEKDAEAYSESYLKELDNRSAVRFASKKSRDEGRAEGRAEARLAIAKSMIEMNMPLLTIHELTKIPISELEALNFLRP